MYACIRTSAAPCNNFRAYENACQLSFAPLTSIRREWHGTQHRNCNRNGGNVIGPFMSHSIASNSFSRIIIVIYREMASLFFCCAYVCVCVTVCALVPLSICRNGFRFGYYVILLGFILVYRSPFVSIRLFVFKFHQRNEHRCAQLGTNLVTPTKKE